MPSSLGQTTLAATPAASTTHASANAAGMPRRVAISVQNATEGAAARPNITQITGSNDRIIGVPRDHGDQEGGRDHVAEAEQAVGDNEAREAAAGWLSGVAARNACGARPSRNKTAAASAATTEQGAAREPKRPPSRRRPAAGRRP